MSLLNFIEATTNLATMTSQDKSPPVSAFVAAHESTELWHKRLGHRSLRVAKDFFATGKITGCKGTIVTITPKIICDSCVRTKMAKFLKEKSVSEKAKKC